MTRKSRNTSDLKRRKPVRIPRLCVLIVCEGEKTEPNYFDAFRKKLSLSSVEVEIVGEKSKSAPINVVDFAIRKRTQRENEAPHSTTRLEYDVVWCVIDVEAPKPHKTLADAVAKAKKNKVKVALSNPCFEYWYVLHFEKTGRRMTTKEAVDTLRKHYRHYRKNDSQIFDEVFPKTNDAVRRAKEVICEKRCEEDIRKYNSSTHVHLVVEKLQDMATVPSSTTER